MTNYKLYHRDCLDIMPQLGKFDLVIADPSYGISYQSAWRIDKREWFDKLENDDKPFIEWIKLVPALLKPTGCLLCFCRWDTQEVFRQEIDKHIKVRSQIIWDRIVHGMGDLKGQFAPRHDVIWFAHNGGFQFPGKRPTSIIRVTRVPANKMVHATEKPLALYRKLILSTTKQGDSILDPSMGSGVAGKACMIDNRKFTGIEINKTYFDIAKDRIEQASLQPLLFTEEMTERKARQLEIPTEA